MRGKFITVEGTEGVGKSTNIAFIEHFFRENNIEFIPTREPGGTPLAEELRSILLSRRDEKFDPTAELLTVFAARAQHLNTVIVPALERGAWVLSDRFTDATYAYQAYGRGLDINTVSMLESLVQKKLRPDKTFLLDIDVKVGLERARARGDLDRFESEEIAFFDKVRSGYLARVNQEPQRFSVIDAGQDLEAVQRDLKSELEKLLTQPD